LQDGGACGLAGEVLGGVGALEEVERNAATAAGCAAGGAARAVVGCGVLGDDEDIEAGEGLRVGGEGAVGCGDEDAARTCVMRGSKSRAALSARWMRESLAAISASAVAPAMG
jgi:hypothetical protein